MPTEHGAFEYARSLGVLLLIMVQADLAKSGDRPEAIERARIIASLVQRLSAHTSNPSPWYLRNAVSDAAESIEKLEVIQESYNSWLGSQLSREHSSRDQSITYRFLEALSHQSGTAENPRPAPPTARRLADGLALSLEIKLACESYASKVENKSHVLEFERTLQEFIACGKPLELAHKEALQLCGELIMSNHSHQIMKLTELLRNYALYHGLTVRVVEAIRRNILPAIERGELSSEPLWSNPDKWRNCGNNIWGCFKGEFGLGQFVTHCYCSPGTPAHINELILASRRIPTFTLSRLEQNRRDGLALKKLGLRDAIHDQAPCIHELVTAMVDYYATNGSTAARERVARYCEILTQRHDYRIHSEHILDLNNYSQMLSNGYMYGGSPQKEPAIDIIRRVANNTRPIYEAPPATGIAALDQTLQALFDMATSSRTERLSTLSTALQAANTYLRGLISATTLGIDPRVVPALSWLDNEAARHLREMDYEEQVGAFRTQWFRNAVTFCSLTAGAPTLQTESSAALVQQLEGLQSAEEAYKLVSAHAIDNVAALVSFYHERSREHWCNMLWSGNVVHELMNLVLLKPASTIAGERHRRDMTQPKWSRITGD